ncbi:MAG: TIGR02680 family protein, partial [Actinomycetota bacterium]|nr:TIGR02680 family protein [Actinomycetota bacterium]
DLFYYDVEEFHFHDGRLLLRGNNGTGKSKVLALTLPFLLDGELAAHRVEPDGDRNKRMEWNLLLGGRHPHTERLGYTWLEFGRLDEHGECEYRTIGCGLKAVAGRGIARHWFFVTSQRIGYELSLLTPTRTALGRERLKDAVAGFGTVYDTARDYRRAVDEALFGLGTHRYEALVNLLIQLRQPQLTKRPDEKLLSRALTEALPPIDPTLVATVADAFRGLDEEREAVRGLSESKFAAETFLGHYRRYAGVAAKRHSVGPRKAHSKYEKLTASLAEAESEFHAARAALAAARTSLGELQSERAVLDARVRTLESSPEMDNARKLADARTEAGRLSRFAESRERDQVAAVEDVDTKRARFDRARHDAEGDVTALHEARTAVDARADEALVRGEHAEIMTAFDDAEPPYANVVASAQVVIDKRRRVIAELDRLLIERDRAAEKFRSARAEVERITGEQQAAQERIGAAETNAVRMGAGLVAESVAYLTESTGFRVDDVDSVIDELEAWVESVAGPNPMTAAVDQAVSRATAELGRRQAAVEAESVAVDGKSADARNEVDRLLAGGHDVPPSQHTRDPRRRVERPGAPLWRVVDFADGVGDADRAGLEAALEAAGILDAWVTPDGELRDRITDDAIVLPASPAPDGGVTRLLVAAIDQADECAAALTDNAVTDVLRSIGLGAGSTWVDVDGRYQIGVVTGSWHKEFASHIGEGARESARRARLAFLRSEIDRLKALAETLSAARRDLDDKLDALRQERMRLPADESLREAHSVLASTHAAKRLIDENLAAAAVLATERAEEEVLAEEGAKDFADDVRLPADRKRLDELRSVLGDYRVGLTRLWPAAQAAWRAGRAVSEIEHE